MNDSISLLTTEDRALLLEKATPIAYALNEKILKEGEQRQALFIIQRGVVRVEREHLGFGVPFARLSEGQIFGEMSLLEGVGASASIVADEDVEVLVIEGRQIQSLLTSVPGFATRFYHSLALALSVRLRKTSIDACPPMCWG